MARSRINLRKVRRNPIKEGRYTEYYSHAISTFFHHFFQITNYQLQKMIVELKVSRLTLSNV